MSSPLLQAIDPACDVLVATDTGLDTGTINQALDLGQLAWCRAHHTALLRIHSSKPSAWLGAHEQEHYALRGAYCRAQNIPILFRLTGGEACYRDARQWNLTLTAALRGNLAHPHFAFWPERLGGALQSALRRLGIAACFVPPCYLEIGGRTLGEVFIAIREGVLVAEAHLFRGVDTTTLLRVLQVPKEKLTPEGIHSARSHFATLDDSVRLSAVALLTAVHATFAEALGLTPVTVAAIEWPAPPVNTELPPAHHCGGGDTLQGFVKTPGGVLYGELRPDSSEHTIESLGIYGDVQLHPHGLLQDLCTAMTGVQLDAALQRLTSFFVQRPHELLGFTAVDFSHLLQLLLGRRVLQTRLGLSVAEANTVMVHDPGGAADTPALLARARVMLVPYCAKPTWCKWRHREGCSECGRCAIGAAYRLGRARGMRVITIRNFEHLEATLAELRDAGVDTYMGMCCHHFFLKREYAFRAAGMPAVLLDIAGANCYELQQEEAAYEGCFAAQSELDLPVLQKVMTAVPSCGPAIPARCRKRGGGGKQPTATSSSPHTRQVP